MHEEQASSTPKLRRVGVANCLLLVASMARVLSETAVQVSPPSQLQPEETSCWHSFEACAAEVTMAFHRFPACDVVGHLGRICMSELTLVAQWYPFPFFFFWFKVPLYSNSPKKGALIIWLLLNGPKPQILNPTP